MATVCEGYTIGIHRRDCGASNPLDTQAIGRFDDRWADAVAHHCADTFAAVDDNHPHVLVLTQHRTQASWHLGGGLYTGKAAAGDHDGITCGASRLIT
ncbi:hypothetical protein D9M69_519430 [compost metagenome]